MRTYKISVYIFGVYCAEAAEKKFEIKATTKSKETKKPCPEKKLMLANKNGFALFVEGFGKRVKLIRFFLEYAQCGCMKIAVLISMRLLT